jgi:hypothetical protein
VVDGARFCFLIGMECAVTASRKPAARTAGTTTASRASPLSVPFKLFSGLAVETRASQEPDISREESEVFIVVGVLVPAIQD